ncbi:alpha-L-rhamnosidase [Cohnella sp. CIP 111063]|uniref:family 78 glycoside hydrolase catalytic domain n=1 Tax=unclassified Cohnella TaxID=2636738 RepID=UPI000B8C6A31|nr:MULTISPECIES: family 78 glycoside hydrolase catalytic domain [unclassified Cohnella]OXS61915.1 alpha-L-rhamnosidase [Cohnella sp. CIP 111063]PRX74371.1 alpha-L-rhamnosidase-like protein [Cohnella sp. SGD-V74]
MSWQALWIWGDGEESPRNEWRCFRRTFDVPAAGAESASLRISADSRYVLYVNGTQVGRGPVRSWPFEQSYDTYEVGHLLRAGEPNTIAALVLHFGVSTFYYLRGRGGLLAQLDYGFGEVGLKTDASWLTSIHQGQHPRSPRMSCQQAFAEYVDARDWEGDWMNPGYDDSGWAGSVELGEVGMAPWTSMKPRDIPLLTEETVYPVRVESLAKVRTFKLSTVVDVRAVMSPGSEEHADIVQFTGYVATTVRASKAGRAALGFLAWGECLRRFSWNGEHVEAERFYGIMPERYVDVELSEGDNLLLIDISTVRVHHGKLNIGVYADDPIELSFAYPGEGEAESPFLAIGPYDTSVNYDHKPSREINWEDEAYKSVLGDVKGATDLGRYTDVAKPIPLKYVSEADVFGLSVWRKENVKLAVPAQLQNAVIPNGEAGVVPVFDGFDTEVLIDLGKEYSGYLSFEIEAEAGTVLDWYGFEYMSGDYRQQTYGLDNTIRYVAKSGRQTYATPVRRGLRYLALNVRGTGAPVKIYGVAFSQSNYPVAEIGRFECSDPLLNDIWEISRHTTKLCMEDTFVDCPAYEQTFWVGDSRNEALVSNYLYGVQDMLKRCLRLVPGSKDQSPLYVDQVPSGWSSVIPNWTFFWAIACKEYYDQTGDRAFAVEMYAHIRFTLEHYLQKIDGNGLFNVKGWNLLDWSPIDQPNEGVVTHQNLFLAQTLRVAAEMGELTGDADGATRFREASERLAAAINEHLWNEEKQAYIDCIHADGRRSSVLSMQTQVVASLTGVAEGERKRIMDAYLFASPIDFVQIGSPFMSFFYYEALAKVGGAAVILDDIRKNYGNMIRHGATTCWEQYPNFAENRANPDELTRSHCHAWSSAPAYFLGRETLGVRSLAPGWTEVEIAPAPCGLTWARGSVPHPAGGRIDVSWTADEAAKTMQLNVSYPADVTVQIKLPEGFSGEIKETKLERLN